MRFANEIVLLSASFVFIFLYPWHCTWLSLLLELWLGAREKKKLDKVARAFMAALTFSTLVCPVPSFFHIGLSYWTLLEVAWLPPKRTKRSNMRFDECLRAEHAIETAAA